ncbi:Methane oxygenase PmoA [Micromonospora pattaloongensis]|uniref:Methane oxygenase PmoA n=1 Tax=Micromonospora pattaloongensis TaxID=405436 RepID=A0A1H3JYA9_9ACTN|nr:PmoA family protein [Micromonospora pattaloongensis]SDY44937.1 Methane oxygenase PmoA [Micromonospora pattaloongensis]
MDENARLTVRGATVAEYVIAPEIDPRHGPRPFLHPVRTLAGVPVTDALPEDHRWHLGVSVAMQDVAGTNLWGGRTYVRGSGYTWRDDHGRIAHDAWLERADDHIGQRLRWCDPTGATLLTEQRRVAARPVDGRDDAWALDVTYTLAAPMDREIALGSPATNGRPGGAGYGGFFWRAAPGPAEAFTAGAEGEEAVNGSTEPWLAFVGGGAGGPAYTLVFSGLGDGDHWFVRTGIYPGVCVALAFARPLVIAAGGAVRRRHTVLVVDGTLRRDQVEALLGRVG